MKNILYRFKENCVLNLDRVLFFSLHLPLDAAPLFYFSNLFIYYSIYFSQYKYRFYEEPIYTYYIARVVALGIRLFWNCILFPCDIDSEHTYRFFFNFYGQTKQNGTSQMGIYM